MPDTDAPIGFAEFRASILVEVGKLIGAALASIGPSRVVDVPLVLGVMGTPLSVGDHVFFRLGLNGSARVLTSSLGATVAGAATAGAVTLDILVGSTLSGVASICGSHLPVLAGASEASDQAPATDWTTHLPDPRWIMAKATAVDGTLEMVSVTLRLQHPDAA